ncbi:hypothetical protein RYX36_021650, partial [Vicia faba]
FSRAPLPLLFSDICRRLFITPLFKCSSTALLLRQLFKVSETKSEPSSPYDIRRSLDTSNTMKKIIESPSNDI